MVNWRLRELERVRNRAIAKERLLRALKGEGEAAQGEHDEQRARAAQGERHGQAPILP